MKKAILTVLVVLAGLVGVVLFRTARMPSLQPADVAHVDVAVDEAAAVERFAGAIRYPTISYDGWVDTDSAAFRGLHDYFEASYPLVHEHLTRETVADLSLLYTWEGTEPELDPVVLMGHMDVVPVIPGTEEDWEQPAFGGVVEDGEIWGRGALDDKISVISILEAVEALLADGFQPRRTIHLAFGHDEEIGGVRGAQAIARLLECRGSEPYALVLDEGGAVARDLVPGIEGSVAIIGIAEKGYVNIELLVEGAGGHSSTPPANTNIGILAEAIEELEENPFPASFTGPARAMFEFLGPEMSFGSRAVFANQWLFRPLIERMMLGSAETAAMLRTTTAVTIVEGGVKANVLPITARAIVNHRIRPGETRESVLAYVRDVIEDERVQVNILGDEGVDPSPVSDPTGPAFEMLTRTIKQVVRDDPLYIAPYLVMGGTDAKYYSGRSPGVFRFLAAPVGADALTLAHGTNERVAVESFLTSVAFFQQLIRNTDEIAGS